MQMVLMMAKKMKDQEKEKRKKKKNVEILKCLSFKPLWKETEVRALKGQEYCAWPKLGFVWGSDYFT